MKLAVVSVAIVALAAAGGTYAFSRTTPPKKPHAARNVESASVSSEDETPSSAPLPMPVPMAAPPQVRLAVAPTGSAEPQASAPRTIFNEVPEAEIPMHVQTLFEAEQTDAAWSRKARYAVADKLDQVTLPGARVDAIECHSTTCKVTADFPDSASQRAWYDKALIGNSAAISSLGMSLYAHLTTTPDGVKSEVYLYRED